MIVGRPYTDGCVTPVLSKTSRFWRRGWESNPQTRAGPTVYKTVELTDTQPLHLWRKGRDSNPKIRGADYGL